MKQYLLTGGRIKFLNFGFPCLLLYTTGAKSGLERRTVLTYFIENNEYYLIASNGGSDKHPSWFYNLKKCPTVKIVVDGKKYSVLAEEISSQDKKEYWKKINKFFSGRYDKYQNSTDREIPVFRLSKL
ncbi:MAG: nitroreductase/quinone reductase family protein [Actinomycetota bacterium]|nr:nitroreductase/quinone reductase family protein [Actinomycetota bacterium]|tara:strand:- start:12282 stop:12665 length:384 start_codon:yes stop_codon:yes gene_type:complete